MSLVLYFPMLNISVFCGPQPRVLWIYICTGRRCPIHSVTVQEAVSVHNVCSGAESEGVEVVSRPGQEFVSLQLK